MNSETIKGFSDFTGKEAEKRAVITEVVKNIFELYGFEPAETPIIESEEFVRGDNKKDEAVSDIYTLEDKGKRKLALRYEFTFQLKRLMQNQKLPYKRYQIGPVFRDEPVKGNRSRQFTTCEADILGSTLKDEAELFGAIRDILDRLKVGAVFYVNNRKLLNEIIEKENINKKYALDIIRELDKLDKLPEKEVKENLKKYGAEKILNIVKEKPSFFKKYNSYNEILELKKYCELYGIKINFVPFLARGLSYYNGTIFEVKTSKIKESVCGGGAYEFNGVSGVGFGVSIERLSAVANLIVNLNKTLIVSINQDKDAIELANKLRRKGQIVSLYYGKPSKALEYANSYGYSKTIFVGIKEIQTKKFKVKDMETGKESLLKV